MRECNAELSGCMAPSARRPAWAVGRATLVVALCALSGLQPAYAQGAPVGSGHFRFAAIHWEKQDEADAGSYAVNFVIRSSWLASYVAFHGGGSSSEQFDASQPLTLVGTKTPSFTIVGNTNVTHSVLALNITKQNAYPYSMGGDWVEGETHILHTFATAGPHRAVFSGCCRINMLGGMGSFEQEVSVDFGGADFAPAVPVVAGAFLAPGHGVSFPAMHPKGMLDPTVVAGTVAGYKWDVLRTVDLSTGQVMLGALPAGVTMDPDTGVMLIAAQGAAHGMYHIELDVSVRGTDSASSLIQLLNISNTVLLMPTLGMATPAGQHANVGTNDQRLEFRTGFKMELLLPVVPSSVNSSMALHMVGEMPNAVTSTVEEGATAGSKRIKLLWDKPCWHQNMARHMVVCLVVSETRASDASPATASYMRRSNPACLHIRLMEDESPVFTKPVADEVFEWEMGRMSTFIISVVDHALLDTVAKLDLSASTPLPTAMILTETHLNGNAAERQLMWEPLPSSGGGDYTLCFETEDTPGISYEHCRLGARKATLCVTVRVARCRYIVRAREALNDVASHFHTDWIQLWALNPELRRPDVEVGHKQNSSVLGAALQTGHLYKVDRGDYLAAVAYKFGTSVKMLVHLNADLAAANFEDELAIGKQLCIIPNSCLRD